MRLGHAAILSLTLLLLAACGGGGANSAGGAGGGGGGLPGANWYVSASVGDDDSPGTEAKPFRTITHALAVAGAGEIVQVLPGTYDSTSGEAFPLLVPAGVTLRGDEANKGGGPNVTEIVGGGLVPPPNASAVIYATMVPGKGAVVAGLRVRNDLPSGPLYVYAVFLLAPEVTLRNDRIVDSDGGIICRFGVGDHVITGNVIQGHAGPGLFFGDDSGIGSRVEGNVIVGNGYGVEYDSAGGDLGGGTAGSVGGNVISCNLSQDLWTNVVGYTVVAQNNFWDHVAPTQGAAFGDDVFIGGGATASLTGAALAPNGCP